MKSDWKVDCDTTFLLFDRKGWTLWREAGFGPGRTTHGHAPCNASETRRLAADELAEQVGRLRLAFSAARREHGKDARRHGASHVGINPSKRLIICKICKRRPLK